MTVGFLVVRCDVLVFGVTGCCLQVAFIRTSSVTSQFSKSSPPFACTKLYRPNKKRSKNRPHWDRPQDQRSKNLSHENFMSDMRSVEYLWQSSAGTEALSSSRGPSVQRLNQKNSGRIITLNRVENGLMV